MARKASSSVSGLLSRRMREGLHSRFQATFQRLCAGELNVSPELLSIRSTMSKSRMNTSSVPGSFPLLLTDVLESEGCRGS